MTIPFVIDNWDRWGGSSGRRKPPSGRPSSWPGRIWNLSATSISHSKSSAGPTAPAEGGVNDENPAAW